MSDDNCVYAPSSQQRQIAYAEGQGAHDRGRARRENPYSSGDLVLAVVWFTGWDAAEREISTQKCRFCDAPASGTTFLGPVCNEHRAD